MIAGYLLGRIKSHHGVQKALSELPTLKLLNALIMKISDETE